MAFFSRRQRRPPAAFWLKPPLPTNDVGDLHAHGIGCVMRGDGPGMMLTGWAIWDLAGLHEQQARDFLRDGYKAWCASGAAQGGVRIEFLQQVFERLRVIEPSISPSEDLSTLPPEVLTPLAEAYLMRCWAGSELLEVLARPDETNTATIDQAAIIELLSATHPAFRPARTDDQLRAWASDGHVANS